LRPSCRRRMFSTVKAKLSAPSSGQGWEKLQELLSG
jgi:hypothetical protein